MSYLYYLHYNTNYVSLQSYLLFYPIYNTIYISLQSYCLYYQTNKTRYVSFKICHLYFTNLDTIYVSLQSYPQYHSNFKFMQIILQCITLRLSYLEQHKYILTTMSSYNPSYESLYTSSIIPLISFTHHTVNIYH